MVFTVKKGRTHDGREGFAMLCPVISALGDYWSATAYRRDPTGIYGIREIANQDFVNEKTAARILDMIDGEIWNGRYRCPASLAKEFGWIEDT